MRKISYFLSATAIRYYDAAIVIGKERADLATAVADAVVQTISTDIQVTLGDTTIHLAALLDPDHWEEDWAAAGVDDVQSFLEGRLLEAEGGSVMLIEDPMADANSRPRSDG